MNLFARGLKRSKDTWFGQVTRLFDRERIDESVWEDLEELLIAADGYSKPDVSPFSLMNEFGKIIDDYTARTQHPLSHVRDFLDCVKSRRPTIANPVVMHRSMTTVHAANICMWLKRDMRYDPVKEEFINDEEANRLRSRAMREPWII